MATSPLDREGPFTAQSERRGDLRILHAVGELDLVTVGTLEESLEHALEGDAASIILDVTEVSFIDSIGLQALLGVARRSRENGDRIHIRCGSGAVSRKVKATGLEASLPLVR